MTLSLNCSSCLNQGIIVLPVAACKFLVGNGTKWTRTYIIALSVDILLFLREMYPLPNIVAILLPVCYSCRYEEEVSTPVLPCRPPEPRTVGGQHPPKKDNQIFAITKLKISQNQKSLMKQHVWINVISAKKTIIITLSWVWNQTD